MSWIFRVCLGVSVALSAGLSGAKAEIAATADHIAFDTPTLAPMAYSQFCLQYPAECATKRIFRGGPVRLSAERRAELVRVNESVNASIMPEPNQLGLAGEVWRISPDSGECHDYAVTKRHELMAQGWPARALLLSEVVVPGGKHHLVLVVRTNAGDLVLDSLNGRIKPWFKAPYQWVRMQMPGVPRLWTTIATRAV
jgi:predicted transglutaminase-like cysteine proteinase